MKKLYCISGLPRAGSTLLCNVLAQNPKFYATQTSGLISVLATIRNQWHKMIEMRAMDTDLSEKRQLSVLKSIPQAFYADIDKPVIFDKSRGWLAFLEMLNAVLDHPVKVLVPVRDLRDVLASFEKLHRRNMILRQAQAEAQAPALFQTTQQRCNVWVKADQPVGIAYNRIADALQRGWQSSMFFVRYEEFTKNPEQMMKNIYAFLEEEPFEHHFTNIKQVTWEDDTFHGYEKGALHSIRPDIKPQPPQYPSILGEVADTIQIKKALW